MAFVDRAANMKFGVMQAEASANTSTKNGSSFDREGFDSVAIVLDTGTITDGTHTFDIEVSDDDTNWSSADADDYDVYGNSGSLAIVAADDDLLVYINWHGQERYVRTPVTVSGGPGTGGIYSTYAIAQDPHERPVNS